MIKHLFFDIGGVLGTHGWDGDQRRRAAKRFGLDVSDFEARHRRSVGRFERGFMSLGEYIDSIMADHSLKAFTPDEFKRFMFAQSSAFPQTVAAARALSATGRYRMMTINNESAELNVYRIHHFELTDIFSTFYSSCWLGVAKPSPRIYELALDMSQANPIECVFIDDRVENLAPARALGMRTILFNSVDQLLTNLAALGVADHIDREVCPLPARF